MHTLIKRRDGESGNRRNEEEACVKIKREAAGRAETTEREELTEEKDSETTRKNKDDIGNDVNERKGEETRKSRRRFLSRI